MLGSIGCAFSHSLADFVAARMVQGVGGAMMTPVGRLILLRSIDRRALLSAMAWVTMPALIGPMVGPPVGGFITTYASWHWIFIINVPIGIAGLVLVTLYIENIRAEAKQRFDFVGMILAGLGLGGVAFGLSVAGLDLLPLPPVLALSALGVLFILLYVRHARRTAAPVLDLSLLSIQSFRATITGGFFFRLGIGAWPFLMPLMLQLGLKMNPFQSGLITFAGSFGALLMKPVIAPLLKTFGFKNILVPNAVISSLLLAACATFTAATPIWWMFFILVVGGFFRSLEFTAINTLAYADVPSQRMSTATSMVSVLQQISISCGVAVGALLVELTNRFNDSSVLTVDDFHPAFLIVGGVSACSAFIFMSLDKDAGAEMANRKPASNVTTDDRVT
jgi:MFS family permease